MYKSISRYSPILFSSTSRDKFKYWGSSKMQNEIDERHMQQFMFNKSRKIYQVEDVQAELEELTEDEEEIRKKP